MSNNINAMIESVSLLSSFTIESSMSETNDEFLSHVSLMKKAFREGDLKSAESRVSDLVRTFGKYKKETLTMYARFTNSVKQFPKYAEVLSITADNLDDVRSQILEDKVIVMGEEDLKRLVVSLIKIIESGSATRGKGIKVSKTGEEIIDEKAAVGK
jgi:hypothetical protein